MIVDAGARGGLKKEWLQLRPFLKCIGFEPDPKEFVRLKAESEKEQSLFYRSSALWDSKKEIILHITKQAGFSSVYFPNEKFLKHFGPLNTQGYDLQENIALSAERLDELLSAGERQAIDFIKVDVEGAAYEILKGAEKNLAEDTVVGLRVEAEFNPKYNGQHLFSDVDQFLRNFGYELFDAKTCRWKRKAGLKTGGIEGQLVHGDFIYLMESERFFEKISRFTQEERTAKTLKFIILACLYGVYDLAFELTEEGFRREVFGAEDFWALKKELLKSQGVLMRIPKLQGRGTGGKLVYHLWMLTVGVWLEKAGWGKPSLTLHCNN